MVYSKNAKFNLRKSTNVGHHVIRIKAAHMIISDAENEHPLMIKTVDKLEIERSFASMIKGIYENPAENIIYETVNIIWRNVKCLISSKKQGKDIYPQHF